MRRICDTLHFPPLSARILRGCLSYFAAACYVHNRCQASALIARPKCCVDPSMLSLFLCSMRPLFLSESTLQCRIIDIQPWLFMPSPSHISFSQRKDVKASCGLIKGECGCMFHEHCMKKWLLQSECCPEHRDRHWATIEPHAT